MQRSYPEIFFKLSETITCDLLCPNFKDLKDFTIKNGWSILKGSDREITNFQEF